MSHVQGFGLFRCHLLDLAGFSICLMGGPNHCFRLPAYSHRHPRGAGWDDGDGTLLIYFHSYARYTRTEDSPRNRHPPSPRRSDQSNWSDAEVLILRRPANDWSPSVQWVPLRGIPRKLADPGWEPLHRRRDIWTRTIRQKKVDYRYSWSWQTKPRRCTMPSPLGYAANHRARPAGFEK